MFIAARGPGQAMKLITSCGTESWRSLKSPILHSPKAIVFEVPSVMLWIRIGNPPPPLWSSTKNSPVGTATA